MKKIILLIFLAVLLVATLTLINSYTPPAYNAINMSLCSGYTAPLYNAINFTLGTSDACGSCTAPSSGNNWAINLADYCVINSDVNLGTGNITFTGTGNVTFNAKITTKNIGALPSNQKGFVGSSGRIKVG